LGGRNAEASKVAGAPTVRFAFAELKKDLAVEGFVSDDPALYVRSEVGDYVIVELQRSRGTWPDLLSRIFVNMAAVAAPWWDWMRTLHPTLKQGGIAHPRSAHGMWHHRLHHDPGGRFPDETWTPTDGTKEAGAALGGLIASHLRHEWLRLLLSMLDRDTLMAQFTSNSVSYRTAMLADAGSSVELDELLAEFEPLDQYSLPFVQWVRGYASGHRAD
jgi:hypothetical protein